MAATASSMVAGRRAPISEATDAPERSDLPKSPIRRFFR